MKPNFALTLSYEGIGLLHRAFPGWHSVGDVALDTPDLAGALANLRETAHLIDPAVLRCKLVIPNDQIRYVAFDAQDLADDDLPAAVERSLDGATPYALEDLAYDWARADDGTVTVAAVARETLNEAEAFAKDHQFNPICTVAIPDSGDFAGEPFFGETMHLLLTDPNAQVERDPVPVRIIGEAKLPDPVDDTSVPDNIFSETEHEPEPEPDADPEPAPDEPARIDAETVPEPEPAGAPEPTPDTEATADTQDDIPVEEMLDDLLDLSPVAPDTADAEGTPSEEPAEAEDDPDVSLASAAAEDDASEPDADPEPTPVFARRVTPDLSDRPEPAPVTGFAETDAPYADEGTEALPDNAPSDASDADDMPRATTFSSIRAQRGHPPTRAPKLDGVERHFSPVHVSSEVLSDHLPRDPDEEPVAPPDITAEAAPYAPEPSVTPPEGGAFATRRTAAIETQAPAAVPPAPPVTPPASPPPHAASPAIVAPAITAARMAAAAPGYAQADMAEEQRMTVFGARDAAIGGKPRYLGLILTAVLLLFLVGVAAWASIFLDDGLARFFRDDPEIQIADVPALPEPGDAATSDPDNLEIAALPQPTERPEDGLQEALRQPQSEELTEDEARARYAATGIWLMAPDAPEAPTAGSLEGFNVTARDSKVAFQSTIALLDTTGLRADTRPDTPRSPVAAGTRFTFDARGLVAATTRGAMTPDGILVYAGQPPVRPAAMPKRVVLAAPAPEVEDADVLRLASFRPRMRSSELAAVFQSLNQPAPENPEDQQADVPAPEAAPETQEAAVQPFIDLDAVNSAVTEAVESETVVASALPQAVASSLKPNTRPSNFDSIVKRSTQPQETAVAVSATQRVAPRIPTTTSVAKQATQRNVLRLRKINLIGVYGTPSNRRALVRLSNGRYRKVQIGDRLDGGKVSAIGDGELRYKKGSRNLVLKMPKG